MHVRALAFCAALLFAPAALAAPHVKNVTGWITALAMDGPHVAYATQAYAPTNCDKVFTWNVLTGSGILVSGPKAGTCGDDEPSGQLVTAVAIAGSRLAWIRNITGNTEADDYLFTATVPNPKEKLLLAATRTGAPLAEGGAALIGRWLGGLVGSGSVVGVDSWSTGSTGTVTSAVLKAVGSSLKTIASGPGTLTAESADTGRIAVFRSDGTVAIYSSGGAVLATVTPTSVREIALRKDYLAVLTNARTLEIYNSHTGAFIRSWPVPASAKTLDVNSDIAVFSVYRTLYALQLTTGKQVVLAAEKRAIVGAEIEAPGVVWAYNTIHGTKNIGNLAFLPLTQVQAALAA